MRTKPFGSTCNKKRRKNSSAIWSTTSVRCGEQNHASESDLAIGKRDQAMIGDGHAVSVATQIVQHIFGPPKGRFKYTTQSCRNSAAARRQRSWAERGVQISLEAELVVLEGLLERIDELAAKDFTQYPFGRK